MSTKDMSKMTPFEIEARKSAEQIADEDMVLRVDNAKFEADGVLLNCKRSVAAARKDLKKAQRAYTAGTGSILDVLKADEELDYQEKAKARAERITADYF